MQGFFLGPKCKDFFTSPKLSSKTQLRHLQACRHASTFRCMCTNEVSSCIHTLHIKGLSLKCMVFVRQSLLHTHTYCTSRDYHALQCMHDLQSFEAEHLAYTHCTSKDYPANHVFGVLQFFLATYINIHILILILSSHKPYKQLQTMCIINLCVPLLCLPLM